MDVRTEIDDRSVAFATVSGEVDAYTASDLEVELGKLASSKPRRVVVDLSGVTFLSSSGLRVLLAASRSEGARGSQLRICGAGSQVRRVLELSGFDKVLLISASREEASADP